MTREDRWIVSLDEIQAVRWVCGRCKAAVSYRLDETINLPRMCPAGCGADGMDPEFHADQRCFTQFILGFKGIIEFEKKNPNAWKLALEFSGGPRR